MLDLAAYRTIDVAVDSATAVAVLTLNRPEKANAVDDVMHSQLSRIFAAAQDDARVRAVVLTGAGRTFSAGGDESSDRQYATSSGRTPIEEARHIVDDIVGLTKPLVAAVNGHAIGLDAVPTCPSRRNSGTCTCMPRCRRAMGRIRQRQRSR